MLGGASVFPHMMRNPNGRELGGPCEIPRPDLAQPAQQARTRPLSRKSVCPVLTLAGAAGCPARQIGWALDIVTLDVNNEMR